MTTYDTTFHFHYEECIDACRDYATMKKEILGHSVKLDFAYDDGNKKYWFINLIMKDLTPREVRINDIAMKLKFKYYDGWDVDTRTPFETIEELGYIIDKLH